MPTSSRNVQSNDNSNDLPITSYIELNEVKANEVTAVAVGSNPSILGEKVSAVNVVAVASSSTASEESYQQAIRALASFSTESKAGTSEINTETSKVSYYQPVKVQAIASNYSKVKVSVFAEYKYPEHVKRLMEDILYHSDTIAYRVGNIPEVCEHYTGRKEALAQLFTQVQQDEICAITQKNSIANIIKQGISGVGGLGKTQLVARYLQQYAQNYNIILWINCSSDILESEIYYSAEQLGVPYDKSWPLEKIMSDIYQQLVRVQKALIVFDGVVEPSMVQALLPSANKPGLNQGGHRLHCIITSQYGEWEKFGLKTQIRLPVFSLEENRNFIYSFLKEEFYLPENLSLVNETVLTLFDDLGSEIGYLPIALALAAAYIKEVLTGCTIEIALKEYLDELKKKKSLSLPGLLENEHTKTLANTVRITLEYFVTSIDTQLCLDTLGICGILPTNIPYEFLQAYLQIDLTELRHKVLRKLKSFSLIQLFNPISKFSMHKMTYLAIRYWLNQLVNLTPKSWVINNICGLDIYNDLADKLYKKTVSIMVFQASEKMLESNEMQRRLRLLPLLKILVETFDDMIEEQKNDPQFLQSYCNLLAHNLNISIENQDFKINAASYYVKFLKKYGEPLQLSEEFINYFQYILKTIEDERKNFVLISGFHCITPTGNNSDETILTMLSRSRILALLNWMEWCQEHIINSGSSGIKNLLPNLYFGIGNLYNAIMEYEKAKSYYELAFEHLKINYHKDHIKIANIVSYIGNIYYKLGFIEEGNNIAQQALNLLEKSNEKNLPIAANILIVCARSLNDPHKRIELINKALSIYETHEGVDRELILNTLHLMSIEYGLLSDNGKQKILLERMLDVIDELGTVDVHVHIQFILDLCNVYKKLGEYAKQKEKAAQVIIMLGSMPQPIRVEEIIFHSVTGACATRYLESNYNWQQVLENVLSIAKNAFGNFHPGIARILNELEYIYKTQENTNKLIDCREQIVLIAKKNYGSNDLRTSKELAILGLQYHLIGNSIDSEKCLLEALAIEEKYGENNIGLIFVLQGLGKVYEDLDIYVAKEKFEKALLIAEKNVEPTNFYIINLLTHLSRVYGKLGEYHKKLDMLERADALCEQSLPANKAFGANIKHLLELTRKFIPVFNRFQQLFNQFSVIFPDFQTSLTPLLQTMLSAFPEPIDLTELVAQNQSTELLMYNALLALDKNNFLGAINQCQQVLRKEPTYEDAHSMLASCYLSLNRRTLANFHYQKALRQDSGPCFIIDYSLFLCFEQKYSQAVNFLTNCFVESSQTCQHLLFRYTPYLEYTLQVLTIVYPEMQIPIAAFAYYLAFQCYIEIKNEVYCPEEILFQFSKYAKNTNNGVIIYLLAICYQRIGNQEEAELNYSAACSLQPALEGLKENNLIELSLIKNNIQKEDYLLTLGSDPRPKVRMAVIKILGTRLENDEKILLKNLLHFLKDIKNEVRIEAANTIVKFKHHINESFQLQLLELLQDESDMVSLLIIGIFMRIETALFPMIQKKLTELKKQHRIHYLFCFMKHRWGQTVEIIELNLSFNEVNGYWTSLIKEAIEAYENNNNFINTQKYEEALCFVSQATYAISPDSLASAHHNLACAYHISGNVVMAEQHFKSALEYRFKLSTLCDYGVLLIKQKDRSEEGIELFEQVLTFRQDYIYLGNLIYRQLEAELLDDFFKNKILKENFITVTPHIMAYYYLIRYYAKNGNLNLAKQKYKLFKKALVLPLTNFYLDIKSYLSSHILVKHASLPFWNKEKDEELQHPVEVSTGINVGTITEKEYNLHLISHSN